eukprot:3377094-Alexandrium_andersonii.AAC.1
MQGCQEQLQLIKQFPAVSGRFEQCHARSCTFEPLEAFLIGFNHLQEDLVVLRRCRVPPRRA